MEDLFRFTAEDFSPAVIILAVFSVAALIAAFLSGRLSKAIFKERAGEGHALVIKFIGFIVVAVCCIAINLIIRG